MFVAPIIPNVEICRRRRHSHSSSDSSSDDERDERFSANILPQTAPGAISLGSFSGRGFEVRGNSIRRRRHRRRRGRDSITVTVNVKGPSSGNGTIAISYTGDSNSTNPIISATLTQDQETTLTASFLADLSSNLSFSMSGDGSIVSGTIVIN